MESETSKITPEVKRASTDEILITVANDKNDNVTPKANQPNLKSSAMVINSF